jgi:hypothetical protein
MNSPYEAGLQVQESAREWNKLQLGVLGFSGICGVLRRDGESPNPWWLQDLTAVAALAGLVLAVAAVMLIASVASPLVLVPGRPASTARRLRAGIGITFVAVACTALSALSAWWPDAAPAQAQGTTAATSADAGRKVFGGRVVVTTDSERACGVALGIGNGLLNLDVDGERVRVPLTNLTSINWVEAC